MTGIASDNSPSVLVVGAGLAGLTAAAELADRGHRVVIVDKGRSVGGRLATRRIGAATLDHGAQFFTVRTEALRERVAQWEAAGLVAVWCEGFDEHDGYPRYRVEGGMNALAKHLAASAVDRGVQIVTGQRAQSIMNVGDRWAVSYDGFRREPDEADAVVVTAPIPQALELLASGAVPLGDEDKTALEGFRYHSVLAVLALVDGAVDLGPAGARQQPSDPSFSFVADNAAKGISAQPAITFHAGHQRSAELWNTPDDDALQVLLAEAAPLLGDARITEAQLKRWRYAGPVRPFEEACRTLTTSPGPLVLAGDAFAGAKVEGAFTSGLAAAAAIAGSGH